MGDVDYRTGKPVYAADNPIRIGGMIFNPKTFTCAATGVKLTLKTAVIGTDPSTGKKEVYLQGATGHGAVGKAPWIKPNQVSDVITERVAAVPDANMRTTDRKFNVAGKAASRGCTDEDSGSQYGAGGVMVETQINAPKPPTTVQNVNLQEKRHNGPEYTNATE